MNVKTQVIRESGGKWTFIFATRGNVAAICTKRVIPKTEKNKLPTYTEDGYEK